MGKIVETKCYNCGTFIKVDIDETKAEDTIFCPKCNLAQSHINKIIQDRERLKVSKPPGGNE
jgi:Zn finger protein HypA/HybF involved in hydrogenase expression